MTRTEYMRDWQRKNKDKVNAKNRAWRKKNAKKVREYNKKYQEENKDRILKINRRYYKKNRAKLLAKQKAYYHKNIQKMRARHRGYRAKKPDTYRILANVVYRKKSTRKPKNVYFDKCAKSKGRKPWSVQFGINLKDVKYGMYWTRREAERAARAFRASQKIQPVGMPRKYRYTQEEIEKVLSEYAIKQAQRSSRRPF